MDKPVLRKTEPIHGKQVYFEVKGVPHIGWVIQKRESWFGKPKWYIREYTNSHNVDIDWLPTDIDGWVYLQVHLTYYEWLQEQRENLTSRLESRMESSMELRKWLLETFNITYK